MARSLHDTWTLELPFDKVSEKTRVKGSISYDHSKKGVNSLGQPKFHNAYRATVVYNGKKYRKRSIDRRDCERFLEHLAELHRQGII